MDPLQVLGRIIENYMDSPLNPDSIYDVSAQEDRTRITAVLAGAQLQYLRGGQIVGVLASPSRSLDDFIHDRDVRVIDQEFDRALANVEFNPREAVSAASNLLESICKVYIEDEGLEMPSKQDLQPVWAVVRKDLGFDPSRTEDRDLQTILSGMIAVVQGIGALRTHASSAHGASRKTYRLEPRHARLAVHSAHTLGLFILESWSKKRGTS